MVPCCEPRSSRSDDAQRLRKRRRLESAQQRGTLDHDRSSKLERRARGRASPIELRLGENRSRSRASLPPRSVPALVVHSDRLPASIVAQASAWAWRSCTSPLAKVARPRKRSPAGPLICAHECVGARAREGGQTSLAGWTSTQAGAFLRFSHGVLFFAAELMEQRST
ncbi:hypothetical protein DMC30DRAFT_57515 [Rhodotorula diobovata]|uniref:Uncharacterized protein n=1 Tax=Rhodotorula diobovata TaxID=5288 RepID=A0A5C5G260_9BASI|nr:hypothetical protein DMC30DRAFT_57515 [Rhodotorula diobovata]